MDLTKLHLVKTILGTEIESSTKYDEYIRNLISDVSAEAEQYLDRLVKIETDKEEFFDSFYGQTKIILRGYPVTGTTTVWNDTNRTFADIHKLDTRYWNINKVTGVITFYDFYPLIAPGALKVQYTGGMASSLETFVTSFRDIAGALATECAYRFQNRQNIGKIAVTAVGGSVTLFQKDQFLDQVVQVLDHHRRHS